MIDTLNYSNYVHNMIFLPKACYDYGLRVGRKDGFLDGFFVGRAVRFFVGRTDGFLDGFFEGRTVGFFV